MEPIGFEEISVLVVDDDPFVRLAVRSVLDQAEGMECAGEVDDGAGVEEAVRRLRPDVILMDLEMPRASGSVVVDQLGKRPDIPPMVILTNYAEHHLVLGALQSGAAGYLLKSSSPEQIVHAVRTAAVGDWVMSAQLAARMVDVFVETGGRPVASDNRLRGLTEREREVARVVAAGMSNQEIADSLHLSLSTVKTNVSRVLTKLGLANRVQLALLLHGVLSDSGPADQGR
ncbi:MAG: response regulator [Dermatophilaceae bacterium]